ncbi:hypothetical protein B484DRAFT_257229 [Ochromonadaceae sp. CCMP2298]|nr:hypothetical protein B484DRAFT_257229 [Ochromonadaceae sp. CCMP2298]
MRVRGSVRPRTQNRSSHSTLIVIQSFGTEKRAVMYSPFSSELRRRHAPSPPKAQEEIVPRKNAQLETVREQKDEQEEQERTPGHDHHDPEKGHVQSPAEQNPSPGRMSTFGDGGIGLDFSFVESHNRLEDETMGTLTRLRKWFQKYFHLEQALHVQVTVRHAPSSTALPCSATPF